MDGGGREASGGDVWSDGRRRCSWIGWDATGGYGAALVRRHHPRRRKLSRTRVMHIRQRRRTRSLPTKVPRPCQRHPMPRSRIKYASTPTCTGSTRGLDILARAVAFDTLAILATSSLRAPRLQSPDRPRRRAPLRSLLVQGTHRWLRGACTSAREVVCEKVLPARVPAASHTILASTTPAVHRSDPFAFAITWLEHEPAF